MNLGRLVLVVAAVALAVAGSFGGPIMPHEWLGLTAAQVVGWSIALLVPALIVAMLYVVIDRQRQIKRQLNRIEQGQSGRGKVLQGPWRRSG